MELGDKPVGLRVLEGDADAGEEVGDAEEGEGGTPELEGVGEELEGRAKDERAAGGEVGGGV